MFCSVQWAPPTSVSITCHQAAAAWAAPTVSPPRTPLTCMERVTHWVAAQPLWRNDHVPSAALGPSETALMKVRHTLILDGLSRTNPIPHKKAKTAKTVFTVTFNKAKSHQLSSALIPALLIGLCSGQHFKLFFFFSPTTDCNFSLYIFWISKHKSCWPISQIISNNISIANWVTRWRQLKDKYPRFTLKVFVYSCAPSLCLTVHGSSLSLVSSTSSLYSAVSI